MGDLYTLVADILSKHTPAPLSRISPKARLYADLRLDSLDVFAIMLDFETTLGITFAESRFTKLRTVSDIVNLINNLEFRT